MKKKKNPRKITQRDETSYREKIEYGQGLDLDPKSGREIKSAKSKNSIANESDWEATLNGGKNSHYFTENGHLGSLPLHDDYGEESEL